MKDWRATVKVREGTVSLDEMDLKIIRALQSDSRETYSTLGRLLGIAHSTVYERVRRLEGQGVIRRYTAIVDTEKVGIRNIMAIMTVYVDPKEIENVAKKLADLTEALDVYTSLSEELLIIARVVASSQEDLHELIADAVAPLPGVLRIRTSVITKKFKETETQALSIEA